MPISVVLLGGGGLSTASANSTYLRLDATNAPVTNDLRINGKVLFNDTDTYLVSSGSSLQVYVNNTKVQEWTITPPAPSTGGYYGMPMGLMLGITYPTDTG
jgi:hypothetical protein